MRITMIGTGYVGLVSGTCFADFGFDVTCVDVDAAKIERLKDGQIPIYEPGLDALVAANAKAGRLHFTTDLARAVAAADVVFIAVGTPSRRGDGFADLSYVYSAAEDIAAALDGFTVVVTKSTVPVGTGDEIERRIAAANSAANFAVASNPEFLREGAAIEDFRRPDRVVIGIEDERAKAVMESVYRPLSLNAAPLLFTGRRTAEMIKYAGNAFLAMKITFVNELADLCERAGGDIQDVARGIGLDQRIGPKFLNAGPGYGGSCFPKDTVALAKTAQDHDVSLRLVEATITANDLRKRAMARRVIAACGNSVRDRTIALLGLTFKPNTDDMRDSPSIHIAQALQDAGARIRAYDPKGMEAARSVMSGVEFCESPYEAAEGASCAVLVTEWNEFRSLDLSRLAQSMTECILVDLRNVYSAAEVEEAGFAYIGVGKGQEALERDSAEQVQA